MLVFTSHFSQWPTAAGLELIAYSRSRCMLAARNLLLYVIRYSFFL